MPKVWKILPRKFDNLTSQLLFSRGFKTKEQIDDFFNPALKKFERELNLAGIPRAIQRINKAIKNQELIIVYGDYDVDGICGSAILYKGLTSLGAKVLPYIPHREKEGYGLSKLGLEFVRDQDASLVITVDNGIVAIEQAKFAKEIGLDLIITDHHLPLDSFDSAQDKSARAFGSEAQARRGLRPLYPEAYAIVHSTKMCGTAVAWCLIKDQLKKEDSDELLQFVAIATVCDLIPLIGLGRAFVTEGLKILNKTTNPGLKALITESSLTLGEIYSYEIGHIIGPRLNAIGRLEHAVDALRLLCTKDSNKAKRLAKLLSETNLERQRLTTTAVEEARLLVGKNKKIHILKSADWSPGIIGLVAARVCEEHYRPAIAISVGETHSKGSARSVDGVNIVEVIRKCSDLLIDVGGHKGAAGFTIANENLEQFKKQLEDYMEKLPASKVEQVLEIEAEIESDNLTKSLAKEMEKFEPFGIGNPRPLLVTKSMEISDVRTVGSPSTHSINTQGRTEWNRSTTSLRGREPSGRIGSGQGKHLKFRADNIEAIGFGMGDLKDLLFNGQIVDLAYYLEINKFNGSETLQLKVKDIQLSS